MSDPAPQDIEDLAPCPFCGEAARLCEHEDESLHSHAMVPWFRVECQLCEVSTPSSEDRTHAICIWNSRAPDGLDARGEEEGNG